MSSSLPWVLGLSASHNGAACLLHGDRIVSAIQEERLLGKKRARLFGARPSLAITYCLQQGGISASDLDLVVLCAQSAVALPENDLTKNPQLDLVGNDIPFLAISHHAGHAVSAFATCGYDEAAALIVDGMGSPTSDLSSQEQGAVLGSKVDGGEIHSIYRTSADTLEALEKHMVPAGRWLNEPPAGSSMPGFGSLGGMFSSVASQIFGDAMDAGKVMGLAPYGTPTIEPEAFFEIREGHFVFFDDVPKRFATRERWPDKQEEYENLAASVQNALEQALLYLVNRTRKLCSSRNLVYAGGVALNSVANERIIRETDFDNVYIIPPAEDSGPAIGAAYHGLWHLTGEYVSKPLGRDGFGAVYSKNQVYEAIANTPSVETRDSEDVVSEAAELLEEGKIIAWFTGPSELGPRALGQRSILCDPRHPDAKARINARVKHREPFRPFAPVILLEEVGNWFDLDGAIPDSPYMLRIMNFRSDKQNLVPAVVHVDGTGRVQTVTREDNGSYYEVVRAFGERTGVPVLLNTSLNVMGEPIVETPEDALWCLLLTQLDACVFDHSIVTKKAEFQSLSELVPHLMVEPGDIRRTPAGDGLLFSVKTPWGPFVFGIRDPAMLQILNVLLAGAIDGRARVDEVFDRINTKLGEVSESTLIRFFAQLRRWRLISFREAHD